MSPTEPNLSENLSEKELKFSYWFVTHKILLRRLTIIFMILLDVSLVGFGLYGFVDYYLGSGVKERQSLGLLKVDLVNKGVVAANKPLDLVIGATETISAGEKVDAAALIKNRNLKWLARFDYYFMVGDGNSPVKQGFILPEEEKFLLGLNLKPGSAGRAAKLVIANIRWMRINPHLIPDYRSYAADRLKFVVSKETFDPSFKLNAGTVGRASFEVANKSAYGFWQVGLPVILYRGESLVGVNYLILEQFDAGEKREVSATWFEPVVTPSRVEARPEVDILNPLVYMTIRR